MIQRLDDHCNETRAKLKAMRELCLANTPDVSVISHARHELMAASMRRSKFLKDEVFPALSASKAPGISEAIDTLNRDLAEKRVAVSRHISAWSLDRIREDWDNYRLAAARVARGVDERVQMERTVILPLLRRLTVSGSNNDYPVTR